MIERGTLRVLVLTPLGEGGAGGIDRMMDGLRQSSRDRPGVEIEFATTRGRSAFSSLPRTIACGARILSAGLSRKFDVVHINVASRGSAFRKATLALCCRFARIPYVVHLHGAQFRQFWSNLDFWRPFIDSLFSRAHGVIVLGNSWREMMVDRLPEIAPRIFILPNATQARAPSKGSGNASARILFLGRLGQRKGVPDLLNALSRLSGRSDWSAVLAGDGEVEESIGLATRLGIMSRVEMPGWAGPDEVAALLGQADILVLPSYDEGLPMAVIEGFAAGLAVITTPVGATPDILKHQESGLFVEPGDVDGLAEALAMLLDDKELRARLGAAARRVHQTRLSLDAYTGRLTELWASVASRPIQARP